MELLKIHCEIYNYDYKIAKRKFYLKKKENYFIDEFIDIYNFETLKNYSKNFNKFNNTIKKCINDLNAKDTIKLNNIKLIFSSINEDFLSNFLTFSILNTLNTQRFESDSKTNKDSFERFELVNEIYNDIILFIDFLFVMKKININSYSLSEKDIKKFIFRIIIIFTNEGFLKFKKTTVYNEKNKKINYTNILEYEKTPFLSSIYTFKMANYPSFIKKKEHVYLIGFYHYSLNIYLIKNKFCKEKSEISNDLIKTIETLSNTKFFIDKEIFKIINNYFENNYTKIKESLDEKLKELQKLNGWKSNELKKLEEGWEMEETDIRKIKFKIKNIQKKMSNELDILMFKKFKEKYYSSKNPIYFIFYYDFRGRNYINSPVSPQSNWMFRFLYNFGFMDKKEIKEMEENKLISLLKLNEKILNLLKKEEIVKYQNNYAWIFLSIGNKFKKNIPDRSKISIYKLIENGIFEYSKFKKSYINLLNIMDDKMDAIETIYYITLINNLKKNIFVKRYVIKDTTASIFQHLGKVLKFKNEEALKLTNLTSGEEWNDTYAPYIDELTKDVDEENKVYFTRQSLKSVIMVIKYNAGYKTSQNNFIKNLDYIDNNDKQKYIFSKFSEMHRRLKKGELDKKILFIHDWDTINKKILKIEKLKIEDIILNLIYFKKKKEEICIFIDKKRYTLIYYKETKEKDFEKMEIATLPNLTHALDGLYARRIINTLKSFNIEIFTIHDAFGVSFNNIDRLIMSAWSNIKINEKFEFLEDTNEECEINSLSILI